MTEFRVGDEVQFEGKGTKFVITSINKDKHHNYGFLNGIGADGVAFCDKDYTHWKKTGRYFPEVAEFMEKIGDNHTSEKEGRQMTLDEAIKNEEEIAIQQIEKANALDNIPLFGMSKDDIEEIKECYKCSKEHEQLAEWLKELKQLKQAIEDIKTEIKEKMDDCATTSIYTRLGFDTALNIIDKHTSGEKMKGDNAE